MRMFKRFLFNLQGVFVKDPAKLFTEYLLTKFKQHGSVPTVANIWNLHENNVEAYRREIIHLGSVFSNVSVPRFKELVFDYIERLEYHNNLINGNK